MPADEVRPAGRQWWRRWLLLAARRAYLGFLLVWRQRRPPLEERAAGDERRADRHRLTAERRLAAEAYHWAIAGKGQRPAAEPRAEGKRADLVAAPGSPDRSEA